MKHVVVSADPGVAPVIVSQAERLAEEWCAGTRPVFKIPMGCHATLVMENPEVVAVDGGIVTVGGTVVQTHRLCHHDGEPFAYDFALQGQSSVPTSPCVKCGGTDFGMAWHAGGFASDTMGPRCGYGEQDSGTHGEHLHRNCRGCSYRWWTPVVWS